MAVANTYKQFSTWCLRAINTCASVLKVLVMSKSATPQLRADGDKLLVLGTGPSLKTSLKKNPEYFRNHTLLAVNTFSLSDEFVALKPRYYVMVDPGLWLSDNETVQRTMQHLRERTTWPMQLVIPHDAYASHYISEMQRSNANIQITYVNYVVFKGFENLAFYFYRKGWAMPQCQNVLVAALFVAVNLGYRRIELFGADHNWHQQLAVDANNQVCMKHIHFFEDEEQLRLVPLWKVIHKKEVFRMDEIFHAWAKVFAGHMQMERYARSREATIVNRSEVTFIDAFEQEKF
ncbi:MAG: hypothetical protein ACKVOR_00950 [Flavobacteriales bacterium]